MLWPRRLLLLWAMACVTSCGLGADEWLLHQRHHSVEDQPLLSDHSVGPSSVIRCNYVHIWLYLFHTTYYCMCSISLYFGCIPCPLRLLDRLSRQPAALLHGSRPALWLLEENDSGTRMTDSILDVSLRKMHQFINSDQANYHFLRVAPHIPINTFGLIFCSIRCYYCITNI